MNAPVDFRTSNYFTGMPYILGFVMAPIGLILLFSPKFIVGAIFLAAGILILTTHFRIAIDQSKKLCTEYISLLGLKLGKELTAFDRIEYVFIKKKRVSQTLNSRASSRTIQKEMFDGFLKLSEDNKIHLLSTEHKEALLKKLKPIGRSLNIEIIDYSSGNPIETK